MPLNKDWREFLELLNSNEVEYLVAGAFALAFHGYVRYTADLDLLVRPTDENANRLLRALSQFGFGKTGIEAADLRSPGMVVQLGVQPNRIDLLTAISGVGFEEAWAARSDAERDGVATHFMGRAGSLRPWSRARGATLLAVATPSRGRNLSEQIRMRSRADEVQVVAIDLVDR
jgi:hypothetical protein